MPFIKDHHRNNNSVSYCKDIEEYASHYRYSPLDVDHYFWKLISTGLADSEEGLRL
jgi:hypothetical protein